MALAERDGAAVLEFESHGVLLDARDAGHLTVDQPCVPVVPREPHPVPGTQFQATGAVRLDTALFAGNLPEKRSTEHWRFSSASRITSGDRFRFLACLAR